MTGRVMTAPGMSAREIERAPEYADTLGLALQLTNILRDIREDASGRRTYLPADDLAKFGCPAGIHASSFFARATTPGDFVLQPAHAEEMYTPEVFGRSEGGRFQITTSAPIAEGR